MDAVLIPKDLRDFIASPVLMLVSVAGAGGALAIARGLGAEVGQDGEIDMFVSRAQWPDAVAALTPGAKVATTFVQPATYETYQVKGVLRWTTPASAADRLSVKAYADDVLAMLCGLGLRRHQILAFLVAEDPVRLRFAPQAVFLQTPGPGAGQPLGSLA